MTKVSVKRIDKRMMASIIIITLSVLSFLFLASNPWRKSPPVDNQKGIDISSAECKSVLPILEYNGTSLTQDLSVTMDGKELILNKDYQLTVFNNINPGEAVILVNGLGDYCGTRVVTFQIVFNDDVCDDSANSELVKYVSDWFKVFYNRYATNEEIVYWVNSVYSGEFDAQYMIDTIVRGRDFKVFNTTNEEFVRNVYTYFLGRPVDEGGFTSWMDLLESNQITKRDVAEGIISSGEFAKVVGYYSNNES